MTPLLRILSATAAAWLLVAATEPFAASPPVTEELLAPLTSAYMRAVKPGEQAEFHRDLFETVLQRIHRSYARDVDLPGLIAAALKTIEPLSFYFTLFLTPLFLFSDVFFPLAERLSPGWQRVAELLPLLHPVRLARAAFSGRASGWLVLWDIAYMLGLSALLLVLARSAVRKRLTT